MKKSIKKAKISSLKLFIQTYNAWILLFVIFLVHIFFRFYGLENNSPFGWDQVDNAWAAKNIIVEHRLPLVGMVAKQNTGFYIGPIYYYFVAFFYWLFSLDPIASVFIAGVSSVISFFVLFFVVRKIFSEPIGLVAVFIHTVSFFVITSDRVQWPINLVAPTSLIIFYLLYKIILGNIRYIFFLAIALGFSLHLNFTSIFFLIITLCALPLFPWGKKLLLYSVLSAPLFIVWLIPNFLYDLMSKGAPTRNMLGYVDTYYHGVHLRRILQLAPDAFIEFNSIVQFRIVEIIKYAIVPIFVSFYFIKNKNKKTFTISYLIALFFLIPWFIFSVYKGEISNYYFSLTRPFALIIFAYFSVKIFSQKSILPKIAITFFWLYFSIINIQKFFVPVYRPLAYYKEKVQSEIKQGREIEFSQSLPESYIYYFYTRDENKR